MATKGMPRQTLAAMTESRALSGSPRKLIGLVDQAQLHQGPGQDRKLRIVDPPEGQCRQHRGNHPWQQHDGAEEGFERQLLVEDERQPQAQHEFQDGGDERVDNRVEHRKPEHLVIHEVSIVLAGR